MATAEMPKLRAKKAKRVCSYINIIRMFHCILKILYQLQSSMPASIGRPTDLLEEGESSTGLSPPTLPPLSFEETDHHILDLLLNENFSELEFDAEQSTPPINSSKDINTTANLSIETTNTPKEMINLRDFDDLMRMNPGREEINKVLLSQVNKQMV